MSIRIGGEQSVGLGLSNAQNARLLALEDELDAKVVGIDWEHEDPIVRREGGRLQRITDGGRMAPVRELPPSPWDTRLHALR